MVLLAVVFVLSIVWQRHADALGELHGCGCQCGQLSLRQRWHRAGHAAAMQHRSVPQVSVGGCCGMGQLLCNMRRRHADTWSPLLRHRK